MRAELVDALACVACLGPLRLEAEQTEPDGHVMAGTLTCTRCSRTYAVSRGVPRLAPEVLAGEARHTVEAFGYQWEQATALFDLHFASPEVFLDFIHPVRPEFFRGKTVLDGGCGSGRFSLNAARFGARLVVGVDLSSSVDVAFDRTRHLPNVGIVQGDLLRLPVGRVFDYAFSVGVLHHTEDPRGAFLQLASKAVPGGAVSAWVYGAEGNAWILRAVNPVRRITSRLPKPVLLGLSYGAAVPFTAVVKLVYGPVSRRPGLSWLRKRLLYFDYLAFLSQFGYREHAIIIFDHAVPAIAEYIPHDAFAEWFRAASLGEVTITSRNSNSWRGFGLVQA